MARCEEGYRCAVCGAEVEAITDSDLYLRYVAGEVPPELLHRMKDRHIRCDPATAQFIRDDRFAEVRCEGDFDKQKMEPAFVAEQECLWTRAWIRLQELPGLDVPILEYPLPEVQEQWRGRTE